MQFGAIIEKGPQDWQIIRQSGGSADISLAGIWVTPEQKTGSEKVYARVVREDTGLPVISWTECQMDEKNGWEVTLAKVPAGGLYRIETCLRPSADHAIEWSLRGDMIHHIGVGDVYVIAGQSNSAGYGKDPVYDPPELGIHLLRNSGKWDLATHPFNESTHTIHEENRELANPGHSPYLNFARILKRELGYPIGLVQASLGGSPLSTWNPEEDGVLYRSMMETLQSQGNKIRGMLWYQGCSDTHEGLCDTYLERFTRMVEHFRRDLKDDELPILTVQLNRHVEPCEEIRNIYWGKVKEAQRQAAKKIKNVFIVPAVDCSLSDVIHNSSSANMVLGERLARVALNKIYGKDNHCMAPEIAGARMLGETSVELVFDNIRERIYPFEVGPGELPFTVEDEGGKVRITGYRVDGRNKMVLELERKLKGKAKVHGAYEQNPKHMIPIDIEGYLPMLAFYGVDIEENA